MSESRDKLTKEIKAEIGVRDEVHAISECLIAFLKASVAANTERPDEDIRMTMEAFRSAQAEFIGVVDSAMPESIDRIIRRVRKEQG